MATLTPAAPMVIAVIFVATYAAIAMGRVPGLELDRTGIVMLGAIGMMAFGELPTSGVIRKSAPFIRATFALQQGVRTAVRSSSSAQGSATQLKREGGRRNGANFRITPLVPCDVLLAQGTGQRS